MSKANYKSAEPADQTARPTMYYLCDHRACQVCRSLSGEGTSCQHTRDITHAKHFESFGRSYYERRHPPVEKTEFKMKPPTR